MFLVFASWLLAICRWSWSCKSNRHSNAGVSSLCRYPTSILHSAWVANCGNANIQRRDCQSTNISGFLRESHTASKLVGNQSCRKWSVLGKVGAKLRIFTDRTQWTRYHPPDPYTKGYRQGKSSPDDGESTCFCLIADRSAHSKDGSYSSDYD